MVAAELTLSATSSSVRQARGFLAATLQSWSAPEVAWVASQVLSELATNAVLHAGTPFTVRLAMQGDALRVEVSDGSRRLPHQRRYGVSATTGRGMALVAALSSDWGVLAAEGGKTVWSLLQMDEPSGQAAAAPDLRAFLTAEDLAELGPA